MMLSLFVPTQNVIMSHQDCLVNLRLSEPAGLFSREEHLHSYLLSSPAAKPHLAVPPFTDLTHHLDLLGDGSLHLIGRNRNAETTFSHIICIITLAESFSFSVLQADGHAEY